MPGTSIAAGPLEALRSLIASTAAFQSWTGAEDATEALGFVFVHRKDEAGLPGVACVIELPAGGAYDDNFVWNGSIWAGFRAVTAGAFVEGTTQPADLAAGQEESAVWAFLNALGDVLQQCMEASVGGDNGFLVLRSIELGEMLEPDDELMREEGHSFWIPVRFDYGVL